MSNRSVLIIDDEVDLCLLLSDYFIRNKYDVTISHSLADGKEKLHTLKPDVLVLDNNLPDGVGWEEAPGFASAFPSTYFILLSAFHPNAPHMPEGIKFRVIEKPISLTTLHEQLAGIWSSAAAPDEA